MVAAPAMRRRGFLHPCRSFILSRGAQRGNRCSEQCSSRRPGPPGRSFCAGQRSTRIEGRRLEGEAHVCRMPAASKARFVLAVAFSLHEKGRPFRPPLCSSSAALLDSERCLRLYRVPGVACRGHVGDRGDVGARCGTTHTPLVGLCGLPGGLGNTVDATWAGGE